GGGGYEGHGGASPGSRARGAGARQRDRHSSFQQEKHFAGHRNPAEVDRDLADRSRLRSSAAKRRGGWSWG
ncbi:unnamed protein product, partial [Ectocarpus fasciculatus]